MSSFVFETLAGNETFWGVSRDTIFTTFVTILIFVLGYLIARYIERKKEKERLKQIRIYFLGIADRLINPIESLIKSYRQLSDTIADKKRHDFALGESHELYLDSIRTLSQVDLFTILILDNKYGEEQLKSKHFKNVFDAFEFIRLQNERAKRNFAYFNSEQEKYSRQWNDNANSIARLFDNFVSANIRNNVPKSHDQFLANFDRICHSAQVKDDRNIYIVKEHLIDPLKEVCKEYKDDPRAMILLPFIIECRMAFDNIVNLKRLFSGSFDEEASKLEKIKHSFKESVAFFRETTSK
ncbi:MAG: hypothetical protein WBD64_11925 [Candidatus Zixiibacteriota bacterium]